MATLYKRGRIYWIAYMQGGYRHQISTKLSDERAAKALLKHYEAVEKADYLKGTPLSGSLLLSEWAKEYQRRRQDRVAPATLRREREAVNTLLAIMGDKRLTAINHNDLEQWYATALEGGRKVTTVNALLRHIKAVLNAAVAAGYLRSNPASRIKPAREIVQPPRTLSVKEVSLILEYVKERGLSAWEHLIRVALYTGARAGELCFIQCQHVNVRALTVTILSSADHPTKSRKSRVVPIPDNSQSLFERLLAGRQAADHLLLSERGRPWRVRWVSRGFSKISQATGIDCTFHDLRRTYGAWLVAAGVDLVTVKENLGHHSIQTTVKSYAHMNFDHRAKAVNKLPAL